jgi:hypothetical protein
MERADTADTAPEPTPPFGFPTRLNVFSLPAVEMLVFAIAYGRRALDVLWGLTLTSLAAASFGQ